MQGHSQDLGLYFTSNRKPLKRPGKQEDGLVHSERGGNKANRGDQGEGCDHPKKGGW